MALLVIVITATTGCWHRVEVATDAGGDPPFTEEPDGGQVEPPEPDEPSDVGGPEGGGQGPNELPPIGGGGGQSGATPTCALGTPGVKPSLSVTLANLGDFGDRTIFTAGDSAVRAVDIHHDGGCLFCSRNGGASFFNCYDYSFSWHPGGIDDVHVVRAMNSGAPATDFSFTPAEYFPSIEVVSCDETVSQDESAAAFSSRLATDDQVVCLDDGVTITGAVSFGAPGVTVIASPGSLATIRNPNGDAVDIGANRDVSIVGLHIEQAGGQLAAALRVDSGQAFGLRVHDSTLKCEGHNCSIASVRAQVEVRRSVLQGGVASGSYSYGVDVHGAHFGLYDSVVESTRTTVGCRVGAQCTVRDSELTSTAATWFSDQGALVAYNNGVHLTLVGSTVRVAGSSAVFIGGLASNPVVVELDGNEFRKISGTAAGIHEVIYSESPPALVHSTVANTFCDEGDSTEDGQFAGELVIGEYNQAGSTFGDIAHLGPAPCSD